MLPGFSNQESLLLSCQWIKRFSIVWHCFNHRKIIMKKVFWALIFTGLISTAPARSSEGEVDSIGISAPSNGYLLDAMVLKKAGDSSRMSAIVFLVGSSDLPWSQSYGNLLRFFFENTFLKNGFAVVYFDKRGVGKSEGTWYETTFEERALDARNVAKAIGELDFIDPKNIFAIGHSQGGWIAQIAVSQYPDVFAGGISMAGPTFGVRKQMKNDYMSGFLCNGMPEERALRRARRKANRDLFLVSIFGRRGNLRHLKLIKDFEPRDYIKEIEAPFLMLFAENDPLVYPEWCLDELEGIFPGGLPKNITPYVAPGEDHHFRISPMCFTGNRSELVPSEKTRDLMYQWVVSVMEDNP